MSAVFGEVVEDFARSLGISGYAAGDGAESLVLELERGGSFCIEAVEGDVLVHLVRRYGPSVSELTAGALAACHPRRRHRWSIRTGRVGDDGLLFAVRMPLESAGVPELTESLETLSELHDRLGSEGGA